MGGLQWKALKHVILLSSVVGRNQFSITIAYQTVKPQKVSGTQLLTSITRARMLTYPIADSISPD
eukprot:3481967-Rhodomonas_salina.5